MYRLVCGLVLLYHHDLDHLPVSLYIGIAGIIVPVVCTCCIIAAAIIFGLCIYYHKCHRKCGNGGCQGILYFLINIDCYVKTMNIAGFYIYVLYPLHT